MKDRSDEREDSPLTVEYANPPPKAYMLPLPGLYRFCSELTAEVEAYKERESREADGEEKDEGDRDNG